jgi:hypothetical protein
MYCKYLLIDPTLDENDGNPSTISWTISRYISKDKESYILENGDIVDKNQVYKEMLPFDKIITEQVDLVKYLQENNLIKYESSDII